MSDEQTKKTNQKHVFKLSTPTTSPTGDEDSIAKVLDWFSRSTDSSDWLNTEDSPEATKSSDKHVKISKLRGEDLLREDAGDIVSDHFQKQTDEAKEVRATDRIGNKELTKIQELRKDTREIMRPQECEDKKYERQPPQISHLKSFWERSKIGPKILIIKSMMPKDKGQKSPQLSAEKDEEKVTELHGSSDMPSVPGIYNREGTYGDEREQQLVISPQNDAGDSVHLNSNQEVYSLAMNPSSPRNLAAHPQEADRRGSDTEILSLTRLGPQLGTAIQSRLSPESESVSLVQSNLQADSISQSRETPPQDELSKTAPVSQTDTDLQTRDSPDSETLYLSRNNDIPITSKTRRDPNKDVNWRDSEDKSMQSGMSPKRKEGMSNRDRINSPHINRHGLPHQETTAEKIKQLKSFWEQEKKPMLYNGKPKPLGDGKVTRGPASQAKLNKRFTKSEYDLSSLGNSGSNEEDDQNVTVVPLNQRIEKLSPSLGTRRTQFNTLREFWDEAKSDTKGSFSFDKHKSPKRKEPQSAQLPSEEFKCGEPEIYHQKTRPAVMKSSPPLQNRLKSRATNDSKNNMSNYIMAELQRESKKSSNDFNREEKSTKPQNSPGKETRSPKNRKDSFETSSSRANSMRRAASMFALCVPDENDQSQLKMDVSPIHPQSRRERQNAEKGAVPRRSEETETLTPRARACVPRDYRHYLGMMDKTSVHTSLAPTLEGEGSEGKSRYEFNLAGPVRASTPVSSEERYSRKSSKLSQHPLWTSYSSSDTGQESSMSSTSDTWSSSRNSSNREHQLQCFTE